MPHWTPALNEEVIWEGKGVGGQGSLVLEGRRAGKQEGQVGVSKWENHSAVVLKRQMSSCSTSVAVNRPEQLKESYEEGEKQALVVAGFPHTNKSSCARKGFSLLHAGTCHLVRRNQAARGLPPASPLRRVPAAKPWRWGHTTHHPRPREDQECRSWGNKYLGVAETCPGKESGLMHRVSSQRSNGAPSSARSRGGNKSAVR